MGGASGLLRPVEDLGQVGRGLDELGEAVVAHRVGVEQGHPLDDLLGLLDQHVLLGPGPAGVGGVGEPELTGVVGQSHGRTLTAGRGPLISD